MSDTVVAVVTLAAGMFVCHCILVYGVVQLFVRKKPFVERKGKEEPSVE